MERLKPTWLRCHTQISACDALDEQLLNNVLLAAINGHLSRIGNLGVEINGTAINCLDLADINVAAAANRIEALIVNERLKLLGIHSFLYIVVSAVKADESLCSRSEIKNIRFQIEVLINIPFAQCCIHHYNSPFGKVNN